MVKTLMELFDTTIKDVRAQMQEPYLKRYIPCDHKLLGTLLAVKRRIEHLEGENEYREKAIKYLMERENNENTTNIDKEGQA